MSQIIRSIEGDTADLAVWRERGHEPGLVERTLDMNPGLAARGPVLPAGTAISLPEPPPLPAIRHVVRLWD